MASALLSLSDVKLFLGISGSAADALLTSLIPDVMAVIEAYTNRTLSEQQFTEYRDGRWQQRLKLANYPLVSMTSLTVGSSVVPAVNDTTSPGYRAPVGGRDLVLQGGYIFSNGIRNIAIVYTAGYGGAIPWPADMKLAALEGLSAVYKARTRQGVSSKNLATESVSYTDANGNNDAVGKLLPLMASACAKLSNYKNVVPDL